MKKFTPQIQGSFQLDGDKYRFLTEKLIENAINNFVESQYPSHFQKSKSQIQFQNALFRIKVRRGKNFLRAFSKGKISVEKNKAIFEVSYSGSLVRGLALASLHTLFMALAFWYLAPTALYFTPVFFVLSYFIQIYLTHLVFPMALAKHLHQLLENNQHENS